MKIEYCAEVIRGYKPTMETEEQKLVYFTIEAKNRVTADRMLKALLKGAPNVIEISGVCID